MPSPIPTRHLLLLAFAFSSLAATLAVSAQPQPIIAAAAALTLPAPHTPSSPPPAAVAAPASSARLQSQDELGVTYTALHGVYALTNASLFIHLWMRRVLIDGAHEVRGFGWLESVSETDLQQCGHWIQARVRDWRPQLQLYHLPARHLVNFTMQLGHGRMRSFGFSLQVPPDAYCIQVFDAALVKLHPSGAWEPATSEVCLGSYNACPLFTGAANASTPPPYPAPHAWNVLPVLHFQRTANVVQLYTQYANVLAHNVIYHHHVGFAGTLQYVSPLARHIITKQPTIKALVEQGWLRLVAWDNLQVLARPKAVNQTMFVNHAWDHAIINQHAVLGSLRCEGTITALVDVDEFFYSTGPLHTFQEAYQDCFTRRPDNVTVGNRTGWLVDRMAIKIEASLTAVETDLWVKTTPDLLRIDHHPLRRYDSIENLPDDQGKQLAAANGNGVGYEIHEVSLGSDQVELHVPTTCAYFMHALSLWESRYSKRRATRRFGAQVPKYFVAMAPLPVFSGAARSNA